MANYGPGHKHIPGINQTSWWEQRQPGIDIFKVDSYQFYHDLIAEVYKDDPILQIDNLIAEYERKFELGGFYTPSVALKADVSHFSEAWNSAGTIEQELPTEEDDILQYKLTEAFGTLEPIEQVFIAKVAVDHLIHGPNRARSLIIFNALKEARYTPQYEPQIDVALRKSLPRYVRSIDHGTSPFTVQEQLITAKNSGYEPEVIELSKQILALFEIDTNDDNAQAQFSRAQIIEALRKTGANPKLAAARLLRS
jgi:hypothetical protein